MNYSMFKKLMAYLLSLALLLTGLSGVSLSAAAEEITADETSEAASDLLANATAADSVGIFSGGAYSYDSNSPVVYGDSSTKSWMFAGDETASGWPTALLALPSSTDMTGKYLEFDVMTEGGRGYVALSSLHEDGSWANLCVKSQFNASATFDPLDWATVCFDLSAILAEGKSLTNVRFIKLGFDFETNSGTERKYYIDNVRLVDQPTPVKPAESTVAEDWIHMAIDGGMSAGATYSVVASPVKAPESNRSLKVVTGDAESVALTFNTQSAFLNGHLDALPNMNEGYIAGYFYFGDQAPSAKLRLTSDTWAGGATYPFTMVDLEDGWYYGYVDVADMYFYADQVAAGANKDAIIRVSIYFPGNSVIYIDGFMFPCDIPEEYHTYSSVVTDPNCTDEGYTTHICNICGHSYVDNRVPALGHSYVGVTTPPSCTATGFTTYTCSVCGDNYVDEQTDVVPHSYTAVVTPAEPGKQGYTTYTCSVCGDSYVDNYTDALPVDENDLLANTNSISYNNAHWENVGTDVTTGLFCGTDTENITGEGSIRSWYFKADADAALSNATAQLHLRQSYDMTGKNLAFDIKYVADTRLQQTIGVRLHKASWGNLNDVNKVLKINPGEWKTVVIDFNDVLNAGADLSDLSLISFYFNFAANTGVERAIYIDNVRLVTDEQTQLIEDPLPEPQDENDMLGQTLNIAYNQTHWENVENGKDENGNPKEDVTSGLTCGTDAENIIGEGSIRSWYFKATAAADYPYAVAQLRFGQSYDMTGKNIAFDIKFESSDPSATQTFFVKLHNSDWSDLVVERAVRQDQAGWQHVVLDFSESVLEGKDFSDVSFISFCFDFEKNTGSERAIYIDNVQMIDREDINADFTNMTYDTGMSTAPVFFSTTDKTYGDSTYATKVVTGGEGANVFTYHAQNAVDKGLLENYLDMSSCIIDGYFYFGDVEPEAALSITEGSWAKSMFSSFSFTDAGDGWYHGTLNSHDIIYDDSDTQAGATSEQILRISLQLPENAVVYLDNFTVTEINPEPADPHDLLGDLKYIVYDKEDWVEGSGLTYGRNEEYLYGRDSVRSWSFAAAADVNVADAIAQFRLKKSHDMSDCTLLLDVYYASESDVAQTIGVRMHNSRWGNMNDINRTFDVTANEWTTVVVDFNSLINEGADLTDLRFISFYFDFASNTGYDRAVYIDNVRLYRAETVCEDWTNMTQDSGSYYKNTETNITNDVDAIKADGSYQGLYIKAPADAEGIVTFNTDQAAVKDEIDALPDLRSGTLGAWFYFGDAEPSAYVTLTEYGWKGSRGVHFTFGEGQNGWYYGTVNCAQINYSETDNPGLIRRVTIHVPAGYEGYIDGLTYTPVELPATLKFSGANLALHHDLSIKFRAKAELFAEGMFSDPYVTYEVGGTTFTISEYTIENGMYTFELAHIGPTKIAEKVYVTLHGTYEGVVYHSVAREYSVADYCYNVLGKFTSSEYAELRALLVDVLNYGAEAQIAFDYNRENLANAKLTDEQKALGAAANLEVKDMKDLNYATVESPKAIWKGAGLRLEKSIGIRYGFYAEDIENLSVVITSRGRTWTYTEADFEPDPSKENFYYVYFNAFNATQLRNLVYATIYEGDTPVSNTVQYSIESYIYAYQNDAQYGELVKAILCYGISAWNYVF